jgi:hypothetical protein
MHAIHGLKILRLPRPLKKRAFRDLQAVAKGHGFPQSLSKYIYEAP